MRKIISKPKRCDRKERKRRKEIQLWWLSSSLAIFKDNHPALTQVRILLGVNANMRHKILTKKE